MKRVILCLSMLMITLAAVGQGPHPDMFLDDDPEPMPPPPRHGFPPPEFEPQSHAMRWLDRLKQDNPVEYERLQQIRLEDPRAFRRELHRMLKQERMEAGLKNYPRVMSAIQDLPEEQRDDLLNRLGRILEPRPEPGKQMQRRRGGPPFPPGPEGEPPGPDFKRLQEQINRLAGTFRDELDPVAQEQIIGHIRELLVQLFELRDAARIKHIERIEQELERLKRNLTERQAMRGAIVERRLRELLSGDIPEEEQD